MIKSKYYVCPKTKEHLINKLNYLISKSKKFQILDKKKTKNKEVVDFLKKKKSDNFYKEKIFYKNYLNWLSKTLKMSLSSIRKEIFSRVNIKKKSKVLFIGCGFGDEINFFIQKYGKNHTLFAQDISKNMIIESCKNIKTQNIKLSISDVGYLPYRSNFFDLVFHFGGYNQFKNKKKSMNEINRVCKINGTVFIADEGMGPWFSTSEKYKALKINNSLWGFKPPISQIPNKSTEVLVTWILKNNFYVVIFKKKSNFLDMNYKIRHKSKRGGSIASRYKDYYKKKLIIK